MTSKVKKLERASLANPVKISVSSKYSTVDTLLQNYVFVPEKYKDCYLVYLLNEFAGNSIIGACTPALRMAWRVASGIISHLLTLTRSSAVWRFSFRGDVQLCAACGVDAAQPGLRSSPHSWQDVSVQAHRYVLSLSLPCACTILTLCGDALINLGSLNTFKTGDRNILLATDVASRGLDIPSVDLIINYDIPLNPKDYIHRVGRTARAQRAGTSTALLSPSALWSR
jgi:ATP-dependent RNA helicase DDX47/RRP3